jgi:glycosyltransferase involved in cell wall biosynthesis
MNAGGAERVAATLVNAWAQRGDEVTLIVTYSGGGTCFYPLQERVRVVWLADEVQPLVQSVLKSELGPAVESVTETLLARLRRKIAGPLLALRRLSALRKVLRDAQPDVVISFLTNVNIATLAASAGLGLPVIVCERTNPSVINNVGMGLDFLRRVSYRFAARVNVQAASTVRGIKLMVPALACVDVIPNPLPPELCTNSVRLDYNPGVFAPKLIVAMGRLSADKQFNVLIKIFSQLAVHFPDWALTIWGEGPMRGELQTQIAALGLSDRIRLPGRTREPWQSVATGQVFAMTSRVEGFPNVLLEAMALGLPCVAFDCHSGPADLAGDGGVLKLIPLDDEAEFATALRTLMQDTDQRKTLGALAQASVRERFSLSRVLASWDQVFAQIKRGESVDYRP